METQKYNGWTNYATWLVAVHIDNDQSLQYHALQLVGRDDCEWGLYEASMELKNWFEELVDEVQERIPNNALITDLINATLGEVDWYELGEHYIQSYKEITEN